MTRNNAEIKAKRLSIKFPEKEYWVINCSEEWDVEPYHVTTSELLNTFYLGLPEQNILSGYRQGELLS